MPVRKTPSAGGKPDKIIRDALMIELKREDVDEKTKCLKINRVVSKLVSLAIEGDVQAIGMIRDSVDGKPAQSLAVGQDPNLKPIGMEHSIRPQISRETWLKLHGDS